MTYATITDLLERVGEARLVQLTDRANPPLGLVDEVVAQRALDDAQAEIDGYLVGRYALPLAPAPGVLRVHCLTLAILTQLRDTSSLSQPEALEVKATRTYLSQVAEGKVLLMPPNQVQPVAGAGSVLFNGGDKVMGRLASDCEPHNSRFGF